MMEMNSIFAMIPLLASKTFLLQSFSKPYAKILRLIGAPTNMSPLIDLPMIISSTESSRMFWNILFQLLFSPHCSFAAGVE